MKKRIESLIIFLGPTIIILVWYLLPELGIIKEFFLPKPSRVGKEFISLFIHKGIIRDIAYTLRRTMLGFIFAGLWGIPTGLFLGYYTKLYKSLEIIIDFFRSLPATALIPLSLIIFYSGETARVFIVLFACGLVLIVNSAYGVKNCNITKLQLADVMNATTMKKFYTVILWEAMPEIFAGLRICLSLSLILVVVSEMFIGTRIGLGQKIYDAQLMNHVAEMYGLIIVTGLIGYGINKFFILFEKRVIHWGGR